MKKKWSKILKLTGLSLMDEEKKIIKVFIKKISNAIYADEIILKK
mgnify:CR=1 FL=1